MSKVSTYFPYLTFIKYNRFDSFIKCLGGTPNLLNNYMKNRKRRKCWKIKMPLFILLSFGIDKI